MFCGLFCGLIWGWLLFGYGSLVDWFRVCLCGVGWLMFGFGVGVVGGFSLFTWFSIVFVAWRVGGFGCFAL